MSEFKKIVISSVQDASSKNTDSNENISSSPDSISFSQIGSINPLDSLKASVMRNASEIKASEEKSTDPTDAETTIKQVYEIFKKEMESPKEKAPVFDKEIIISVASVVLTAVIVSAGVVIKNQVDRYRAYSNEAKKIICKYDPTFKNEPLDKIIIGMATVPNEDINPMFPTVIAIPPTLNEVQAYLSACALFENVNPAYGRNLSAFVPIYASGEISDSYIFASDRIDINSGDQYLGVVEFTFWGKNFSWDNVKKLMAKKSK